RNVAATVLSGQLQRAYFTALPDLAIGRVAELIGTEFTEFSPRQQAEIDTGLAELRESASKGQRGGWSFEELLEHENVAGQTAALNHIAYYAGAVAFMFLLFAAAQNAVGILDDQAAGILDRIAAGPGGMTVVVNGRFIFLVTQGMVQGTVIFAVAWLLYGVDVPGNFGAWLLISFSAAVLAAGLGLLLVTACRTRAQAQILPTVVILIMSAVGGSMVPRFFMPGWLQTLGWITPNTWALEAYSGLFWRGEPLLALLPRCAGLFGVGLLALALRVLAFAFSLVKFGGANRLLFGVDCLLVLVVPDADRARRDDQHEQRADERDKTGASCGRACLKAFGNGLDHVLGLVARTNLRADFIDHHCQALGVFIVRVFRDGRTRRFRCSYLWFGWGRLAGDDEFQQCAFLAE
ncbi:MAG: ABC transporter permease, partial [Anaerolineae bacterium]|nr:ABC transporter permease [Anaerolineae bacterium]